ncbi:unnamed protein product [Urochloa decumbens]|uniref:Uncharacterized protein n=1 Tax=Urochloa decumbens TaxID=240449 RepID=A0ABC9B4K1_9POAL
MKITLVSSKAIKPAYGVAPSTGEAVPLTVLDKVNFDMHFSGIYLFRPQGPCSADLEAGFAKALAEYREWAGRLAVDTQGRRTILLNDAGARFAAAVADVALDNVMPLEPTPEVLSLTPSAGDGEELMLVQVTRFTCGSLVVGFAAHHLVADGRALFNFLMAWGQATRGVAIDPVPVHDRASFFKPRQPPKVEFEHRGAEFEALRRREINTVPGKRITVARVHFSREMISMLKSQASATASAPRRRPHNTLQCVVAHLWRCITRARGLNGDTTSRLHIAVDGRSRLRRPQVPSGYTGNVVLWARPATTVQEEGLVPAANATKRVRSPDMEVFSLMGLPSRDLDFGAGRPFLYMPSYLPEEEGVVFIVPSFSGDGSINAQVSLFSEAMEIFKGCCYSALEGGDARL